MLSIYPQAGVFLAATHFVSQSALGRSCRQHTCLFEQLTVLQTVSAARWPASDHDHKLSVSLATWVGAGWCRLVQVGAGSFRFVRVRAGLSASLSPSSCTPCLCADGTAVHAYHALLVNKGDKPVGPRPRRLYSVVPHDVGAGCGHDMRFDSVGLGMSCDYVRLHEGCESGQLAKPANADSAVVTRAG